MQFLYIIIVMNLLYFFFFTLALFCIFFYSIIYTFMQEIDSLQSLCLRHYLTDGKLFIVFHYQHYLHFHFSLLTSILENIILTVKALLIEQNFGNLIVNKKYKTEKKKRLFITKKKTGKKRLFINTKFLSFSFYLNLINYCTKIGSSYYSFFFYLYFFILYIYYFYISQYLVFLFLFVSFF